MPHRSDICSTLLATKLPAIRHPLVAGSGIGGWGRTLLPCFLQHTRRTCYSVRASRSERCFSATGTTLAETASEERACISTVISIVTMRGKTCLIGQSRPCRMPARPSPKGWSLVETASPRRGCHQADFLRPGRFVQRSRLASFQLPRHSVSRIYYSMPHMDLVAGRPVGPVWRLPPAS